MSIFELNTAERAIRNAPPVVSFASLFFLRCLVVVQCTWQRGEYVSYGVERSGAPERVVRIQLRMRLFLLSGVNPIIPLSTA